MRRRSSGRRPTASGSRRNSAGRWRISNGNTRPGCLTPARQSSGPRFWASRPSRRWKPLPSTRIKSPASMRSWPPAAPSTVTITGAPQNRRARPLAEPARACANLPADLCAPYRHASTATPWAGWPASVLGRAALLEPVDKSLAHGIGGARDFERGLLMCVVGAGVDVGALSQEILGHPALATVAGLPECRIDLAAGRRRIGGQELIHLGPVPQPGRLPQAA